MKLSQIAGYYLIGGASTDPTRRHIGHGVAMPGRDGWQTFIENFIKRDVALGITKFHLHNPFGLDSRTATMPFDQYRACGNSPNRTLRKVADSFENAWTEAIEELGIEVTAYIGCLRADKMFDTLSVNGATRYFDDCTRAIFRSGCNIAIDSVSSIKGSIGVDDIRYGLMRMLELDLMRDGRRLFQEPRPAINTPHLSMLPVISLEKFFDRSDPDGYADAAKLYTPTNQLSAYRLIVVSKPGEELVDLKRVWQKYPGAEAFLVAGLAKHKKPISELLAINGMGGE